MKNCNELEEFFVPTKQKSANLEKPKHKVPKDNHTTEHQKVRSNINGYEYEIGFGPQPDNKVPANPFASKAQQGYMYSHPQILGKKGLAEWSGATDFKHLPKRKKK